MKVTDRQFKINFSWLAGLGLCLLLAACGDATSTPGSAVQSTPAGVAATGGNSAVTVSAGATPPQVSGTPVKTASGLQYIDLKVGTGADARKNHTVSVNYTGWLAADGKKFDSSIDRSKPFSFVLGVGGVIQGWDEGVAGMKVGGVRRLLIPADLGYGKLGYPPVIPASSDLIFDVELLDAK